LSKAAQGKTYMVTHETFDTFVSLSLSISLSLPLYLSLSLSL
jgi:hypothetical protein